MAEHKKGEHVKWEERLKIQGALRTGAKPGEIAKMIGCCRATIYNEINRGQCTQQHDAEFVEEYCADVAERKYQENLRAKGPDIKLGTDFELAEFLENKIIKDHFSPGAALATSKKRASSFLQRYAKTRFITTFTGAIFL